MKLFVPLGRPKKLKHACPFPVLFDEDMLEEFDACCSENELNRSEMLRQLARFYLTQQKEDKDRLEKIRQQGEKRQAISILAQTAAPNTSNVVDDININGKRYTEVGKRMETVFKLLNQIDNELETLPDRQMKNRFKMVLKPFREEICNYRSFSSNKHLRSYVRRCIPRRFIGDL